MGIAQMAATSGGRRFKRPYVDEINARTPYLPSIYQQKKSDEYADKNYALSEARLAQDEKFAAANLALQEDAQKEAKKRNKTARQLGYANIGLGAGLGILGNYDTIKEGYDSIAGGVGDLFNVGEGLAKFAGGGMGAVGTPGQAGMSALPKSGAVDFLSQGVVDNAWPVIKNIGGWAGETISGIYDGIVGDVLDFDWSDAFTDVSDAVDWTGGLDEVIDFGW